jgi:hypothetical protein
MTLRSHWSFVAAGTLLVVATNAIVLLGVAYNRKQPATSELILTERELATPVGWSLAKENSGMNLQLNVQIPTAKEVNLAGGIDYRGFPWGAVPWLTTEKLKSLGFPISQDEAAEVAKRADEKLLPRDVYVVLELNGASYQDHLQEVAAKTARDEQLANADPNDKTLKERAQYSRRQANRTENLESRLYCVDASLDPAALRGKYPDRYTYAIVRGTIRTSVVERNGKWRVDGQFSGVRIPQINVPLNYRPIFGPSKLRSYSDAVAILIEEPAADQNKVAHYTVTVDWGRRLEPWIASTSAQSN